MIFQAPIRIWTTGSILYTRPSPPSTNGWPSSVRGPKSRRIVSRDRNGVARGMGTDGEGTSANTRHLRRECRRNALASRRTGSFIPDWSRTITITCIDTPGLAGIEGRPMCTRMWPDTLLDEVSHNLTLQFHIFENIIIDIDFSTNVEDSLNLTLSLLRATTALHKVSYLSLFLSIQHRQSNSNCELA